MKTHNFFREMKAIYECLSDEESKKVFEARIAYMLDHSEDNYENSMLEVYDDWNVWKVKERLKDDKDDKEIILFGCGHDGRQAHRLLLRGGGGKVAYYCDNYRYGEIIDGIKVLSVDEVIKEHGDALVVITSYKYGEAMYIQLVQSGFPYLNILLPKYKRLLAMRGEQYFDVFDPRPDEIYVDAGTYDGGTVLDFCKWTKGNYKKIYAFEPVKDMCDYVSQKMKKAGIKNLVILNNAVWNRKETLKFYDDGPSSGVSSNGELKVQGVDIDSVLRQEKVTFIKMDVEGSELKALEGAQKTIKANKPRLAICIYHKPMDLLEIGTYLLELVPEYKFYIRHYCSNMWETVLYADISKR